MSGIFLLSYGVRWLFYNCGGGADGTVVGGGGPFWRFLFTGSCSSSCVTGTASVVVSVCPHMCFVFLSGGMLKVMVAQFSHRSHCMSDGYTLSILEYS